MDVYGKLIYLKDDNDYPVDFSIEEEYVLYSYLFPDEYNPYPRDTFYDYLYYDDCPGLYSDRKSHFVMNITDDIICTFSVKKDCPTRDNVIRQIYSAGMELKKKITGKDFSEYGKYKIEAYNADEAVKKLSEEELIFGKNNISGKEIATPLSVNGSAFISLVNDLSHYGYELDSMVWYEDSFRTQLWNADYMMLADGEYIEFCWKDKTDNSESSQVIRCRITYGDISLSDRYKYTHYVYEDEFLYKDYDNLYTDGNGGYIVPEYMAYWTLDVSEDCPIKDEVISEIYNSVSAIFSRLTNLTK